MTAGGDQVIPRPAGAVPGGPAPWAALSPADRRHVGLDRVMAAVAGPIPIPPHAGPAEVLARHHRVPTRLPPELLATGGRSPAAVLVAVFEEHGEARVVLTRRAGHLRSHRHEVSFPGGRLEPGESPEDGARREAAEEVGLDPGLVTAVGRLSPMVTVSSMNWMVPVVASLPERPALVPNPDEVARVFDVALADLAADGVFREERWPVRLRSVGEGERRGDGDAAGPPSGEDVAGEEVAGELPTYPVWFFELAGETIWGATARVLFELLTLVLVGPDGERRG